MNVLGRQWVVGKTGGFKAQPVLEGERTSKKNPKEAKWHIQTAH